MKNLIIKILAMLCCSLAAFYFGRTTQLGKHPSSRELHNQRYWHYKDMVNIADLLQLGETERAISYCTTRVYGFLHNRQVFSMAEESDPLLFKQYIERGVNILEGRQFTVIPLDPKDLAEHIRKSQRESVKEVTD